MKPLQTCTYIFVAAVVLITSILQFHHHNAIGNMCLFDSESSCCTHSHSSTDNDTPFVAKSCSASHSHNAQSDNDNDNNCGLKLSKMNAQKECKLLPTFNSDFIIIFDIISKYFIPDNINENIFNTVDIKFKLPKKHILNSALRAPPVL